ncbi:hypothetical protein PALB_21050 [Pseudoalteromonas luteoviolacea B = ATCC 29581]|nr:hypothetical protein PALB_21050 [Pseudoalteromonas luteoviolacea B = ATCC 29581]
MSHYCPKSFYKQISFYDLLYEGMIKVEPNLLIKINDNQLTN